MSAKQQNKKDKKQSKQQQNKKDKKQSKQQRLWVYGAVPPDASLEELEKRERLPEVWIVEDGDLGAVVGKAPEESERGTRDQALAHARVLEATVVDAPVVPFRFGTIVEGEDERVAHELLEPYSDELARRLDMVKDLVQMTVKASYDEQTVLREIIQCEPELAELQKQTRNGSEEATHGARVRFGEFLYKALEQRRQSECSAIVEKLKPVSVAFSADEVENEFMVLNVAFLVKRNGTEEFEQAVAKVADARQEVMRFTLLGPMPAYNFIEVEEPVWE